MEDFSCEESVGAFIQAVLLDASRHPDPVHDPEYDVHFDRSPSWGSPAVRVETAQGYSCLLVILPVPLQKSCKPLST